MSINEQHEQHEVADPGHELTQQRTSDDLSTSALDPVGGDALTDEPDRRRGPLALVGVAALGTVSSLAVAGVAYADRGGDWGYRGGGRHWWGVGGMLVMLALVAAAAATAALLVSRRSPSVATPSGAAGPMSAPAAPNPLAGAEAILAERLARGEINPDDYRASVAALRGVVADPASGTDPS